jgi:hypothetical protein
MIVGNLIANGQRDARSHAKRIHLASGSSHLGFSTARNIALKAFA